MQAVFFYKNKQWIYPPIAVCISFPLRSCRPTRSLAENNIKPQNFTSSVAPRQPLYLARCKGFESPLSIKIKATPTVLLLLGALQGIQSASPSCVLGDRRFAAVPASHFAPKNSPQGCFLRRSPSQGSNPP